MIGDGSKGIKSLTSRTGKSAKKKIVLVFTELDFFSKLKPVSTFLLTDFHMKNKFSPDNVLIIKTVLEIILSVFLKYIF